MYAIWLAIIQLYSFDKKSMTKSHALGIRITCIMLILEEIKTMRKELKEIFIHGCNEKIEKKGDNVGLSFYAFFKNKNDNPELLMEAANWWIMQHKLDHFEKAVKIKALVLSES